MVHLTYNYINIYKTSPLIANKRIPRQTFLISALSITGNMSIAGSSPRLSLILRLHQPHECYTLSVIHNLK